MYYLKFLLNETQCFCDLWIPTKARLKSSFKGLLKSFLCVLGHCFSVSFMLPPPSYVKWVTFSIISFPWVTSSSPRTLNIISTLLTLTGKLSAQNSPLSSGLEDPTSDLIPLHDRGPHISNIEVDLPPDLFFYQ